MAEPVTLPPPTQDEKTMALLAEIFQIFSWWIGPLVFYVVKRDSKFVAFHAMQALLWQCTMLILWMVIFALWMMGFFLLMFSHMGRTLPGNSPPPPMFFAFFAFFWLAMMGMGLLNIIIGIVYGVKASRGEWAEYPLLGRLARRIVTV